MQIERTGPALADPFDRKLVASRHGIAQLAGHDPGPGQAQAALLLLRRRHQQVEAIMLQAIEVDARG